ncbi:carotenoid oxygenase family protein [Noviherbaspirillum saxi]|uniref:Carotenoid oxygenase family protein n=1 Tax=Noviherbaspirillum saxi TaxID=2320863 RepID=A0A3A3FL87_9BURK|nr:carotenoid oxygenase family protein [Noviherbaspirillum saxi]RJF92282.1 carotenoid oxygenase family protein [Noviherbaspirillum saxi]
MSEPFHAVQSFYGTETPLRFEADVHDCEVIGRIPAELEGTLYRAGPDTQFPTLSADTIVNGDGIVSSFDFRDGHVAFKCRYVKTERFLKERAARSRLYGAYRNQHTDAPETRGTDRDNTANTTAFFHAGRLLALREDSHPHQIDPDTLETLPKWDFAGRLKGTALTAHPKIDPVTGEWWSYGFYCRGTLDADMALQVIDAKGDLVREEFFRSPYAGLAHDFGVTREHVIFAVMPLTTDPARIAAGGDFYAYDPDLPSLWGIMRRDASVDTIRWFKLHECMSGHIMNAYTEGDVVHIDATISPGSAFPFFNDVHGNKVDPARGIPLITRLSFDLSSADDYVVRTPFPGAMGEMPRCDPRYVMQPYRWGFIKTRDGIGRLDWKTRELVEHLTPGGSAQEPVFVPRRADSMEGDGFLLSVVNKPAEGCAELYVLDAQHMEAPPLARVRLPFKQPMAFHGNFVPRADRK